jgi:hypothetical protein
MAKQQAEIPAPKMGGSLTKMVRVLFLGRRLTDKSKRKNNIMYVPEEVAWRKTKAYRLLDKEDIERFKAPVKAAKPAPKKEEG